MCRLAMMNNAGIKHIEEEYGLENLFNYLEKRLGGHGNGICFIYKDGSYEINKGVNLTNKEIVEEIIAKMKRIKWIIYHTRLASIGRISDRNCHPFEDNGRVMAMNGTERKYTIVDKYLTDTENILLSTENITNGTKDYNSVFLGYENGKVFANKNFGSLKYIACRNHGKIFASDFPAEYYDTDVVYEAPECYREGLRMGELNTVKRIKYLDFGAYGCYEV